MTEHTRLSQNVKCRNEYTGAPVLDGGGESRTKQSFRDACDINFIVKHHASTGLWSHLAPIAPTYGDVSHSTDLQANMAAVQAAQEEFGGLPAAVRAAANNNPVQFLEMLSDEGAYAHLVSCGLPTEPPPQPAEPAPIEPAPAPATPPIQGGE